MLLANTHTQYIKKESYHSTASFFSETVEEWLPKFFSLMAYLGEMLVTHLPTLPVILRESNINPLYFSVPIVNACVLKVQFN